VELLLGVKDGVTRADGVSMGDILNWNHYGTETIPPRPVLRNAAEKIIPKNKNRIEAFLTNLLRNPREAQRLETVLLQSLGAQCVKEARDEIDKSENLQHNAPRTVAKKGFDKPLEETGQFKKALAYEVTNE
jgi:hypothetical protein